ncbi:hypothetical protein PIB30_050796 [Stylosanthes scabra]|uniref:RNase H type-1 domain-containing protein n=1 Tax=Stylosanthes scabra TaxID=79078 RepID=A0ABU6QHC6_9FABA|nr:hypothetical protein [Stylosanthes scabra]
MLLADLHDRAVASFSEQPPSLASNHHHFEPPVGSQSPSVWRAPQPGKYKIHVYAANINGEKGGVGVVIRDSYGVVVAAATLEADSSLSVREAEAYAFYQGLNIVVFWK